MSEVKGSQCSFVVQEGGTLDTTDTEEFLVSAETNSDLEVGGTVTGNFLKYFQSRSPEVIWIATLASRF